MRKREESKRRIHKLDAEQQYAMMAEQKPNKDAAECFARPAYMPATSHESINGRRQEDNGKE